MTTILVPTVMLHMRQALTLLLSAIAACSIAAQGQTTSPHSFTAQWITADGAPAHDPAVLRLRKELVLTQVPAHFIVHVSADNQFLLFVNGKRIGTGPSIGDVQHWRYETYDLAPVLHVGSNLLAATVWNLGDLAPIRQISSQLGFVLDPDSPAEAAAATNTSWLALRDPGFTFLPNHYDLGKAYYVASAAERLDAHALDWSWSDPAIPASASSWRPAVSLRRAALRGVDIGDNYWLLISDQLPTMEYAPDSAGRLVRSSGTLGSSQFPAAPIEIAANTHATLLLDHETLTTAFPSLTVSGGNGSHVRMRYAEALVDDKGEKGNRNQIEGKHLIGISDELLPDGASGRTFTPLDWRTWRYLEIDVQTADQPLHLDSFTAAFTAFPFEHRATFASDDPSLTDIWDVGWRTARLCAHDAYMDTPYWERLQYVGDTRIQALISYTNAGDDRLARQAIEAFHDSLLPEGITQSRYPSRHLQVIQNFSLLWIGMVHDFWYYRNDPAFVRKQIPAIRSELSYFRQRLSPDGLPALKDWWLFVDWATGFRGGDSPSTADGVSAAGSLFYLEALRNAADLERTLGDAALGQEDAAEAGRVQKTIYDRFWSPTEQLIADTSEKQHFSQQANALAVWLDVVPRPQQADVITRIYSATDPAFHASRPLPKEMSPASSYFRFYLTRALVHAGLGNRYLETVGPWRTMLSNGLTTWAEQPEPTRSDSHAWSAHPNIDLLTTVAGITPATPDFASVDITPGLGPLHHLEVAYPSPRGEISAVYTVTAGRVTAEIKLPAGLTGALHWNGQTLTLKPGSNHFDLPIQHAS
ncbi:glycoside hydrolase family 78 protein [Granulicella arctica]|uniref:glycoside hydrolase family 78 protein n=1 Tax=Granulicella arctica TaxID=940613 RepID=UPI0021DFAA7C|nr:glycoside hydrolase family 78 protein [Granulicella arctica]